MLITVFDILWTFCAKEVFAIELNFAIFTLGREEWLTPVIFLFQACFPWLSNNLLAASGFYRQALWMKHFGHMCLKRTLLWSTSRALTHLDLGPIQKGKHRSLIKTAIKYKDKEGRARYKGAGKQLKDTQLLNSNYSWIFEMFLCVCETIAFVSELSFPTAFPFASKIVSIPLRWQDPRTLGWFPGDKASYPWGAVFFSRFKSWCFIFLPLRIISNQLRADRCLATSSTSWWICRLVTHGMMQNYGVVINMWGVRENSTSLWNIDHSFSLTPEIHKIQLGVEWGTYFQRGQFIIYCHANMLAAGMDLCFVHGKMIQRLLAIFQFSCLKLIWYNLFGTAVCIFLVFLKKNSGETWRNSGVTRRKSGETSRTTVFLDFMWEISGIFKPMFWCYCALKIQDFWLQGVLGKDLGCPSKAKRGLLKLWSVD